MLGSNLTDFDMTLRTLLQQRLVFLDGAMGTMIQAHQFSEQDYRGQRFATWTMTSKATMTC